MIHTTIKIQIQVQQKHHNYSIIIITIMYFYSLLTTKYYNWFSHVVVTVSYTAVPLVVVVSGSLGLYCIWP